MSDSNQFTAQPPRQTWQQMADELQALRILELEDDIITYRMLACAALENVAHLTKRNKQLADRIDHLTAQLHAIMAAPCLTCRRNRSDRAA